MLTVLEEGKTESGFAKLQIAANVPPVNGVLTAQCVRPAGEGCVVVNGNAIGERLLDTNPNPNPTVTLTLILTR